MARADTDRPMRRALVLFALAGLLAAASACGPIEYVSQVTRTAASAVDDARAVDAERLAPYDWTRAIEYLRAAREQAAHANFQAANRFGRLAAEAAVQARADALAAVGAGPSTPTPTPTPAPAAPSPPAPGLDRGDDDLPPLGGGR